MKIKTEWKILKMHSRQDTLKRSDIDAIKKGEEKEEVKVVFVELSKTAEINQTSNSRNTMNPTK